MSNFWGAVQFYVDYLQKRPKLRVVYDFSFRLPAPELLFGRFYGQHDFIHQARSRILAASSYETPQILAIWFGEALKRNRI